MLTYLQTHPRSRPNLRRVPVEDYESAMTDDLKTFSDEDQARIRMMRYVGIGLLVAAAGLGYFVVMS